MKNFDFHTHNKNSKCGIINLIPFDSPESGKLYSVGLHPYYAKKIYKSEKDYIISLAKENKIVMVGECGFDPKSELTLSDQTEVFMFHVEISEKFNLPLIIHCVKFYNELIKIKKKLKPRQAWIIHGYNSKITIFRQLYEAGFYFSFSPSILTNEFKLKEYLKVIGTDFFIESDDTHIRIDELYEEFSRIVGISSVEMSENIDKNLKKIGICIGKIGPNC